MVLDGLTSAVYQSLSGLSVTTQTILLFLTVFLIVVKYRQSRSGIPPGPTGVPFLGVLPFLGKTPHKTIQTWWHKYGDVYSMYMGSRFCIVINGADMMREAMVRQGNIFSGRPWNYFRKVTRNKGIVFTEGHTWQEHRRFTMSSLRDFGMGKVILEDPINTELQYLMSVIDSYGSRPFNVDDIFPKAVSNIICSIIYGSRFDYDNEIFISNIKALSMSVRKQSLLTMVQFLPILEFLPNILPKDKELMDNVKKRDEYARQQIEEHKASCDYTSARDFIDAYLMHLKKLKDANENTTCDESHLHRIIQDLFIAGTETVTTSLKWNLLLMAKHQNIQQKVHAEICRVIGQGRTPTMADRPHMAYTEATIMECARRGNIALFNVPRCTTQDTTLDGYRIPKGTWVFVNRWGVHASARYWPNPQELVPERFLTNNNEVYKPEGFFPFGMGPRMCLGESLAKMEMFLFFTTILQRYHLTLPEGQSDISMEPQAGINMSPQPFNIRMTAR